MTPNPTIALPISPAKPNKEGPHEGQDSGQKRWHQPSGYCLGAELTILLAAASESPGLVHSPTSPANFSVCGVMVSLEYVIFLL